MLDGQDVVWNARNASRLVCQGFFVVGAEAWVVVERVRGAEGHAFEERGVLLALLLVDFEVGVASIKFDRHFAVVHGT